MTIYGPDAGPIAAGLTTAFAQVATDIEHRHQHTTVKVQAGGE